MKTRGLLRRHWGKALLLVVLVAAAGTAPFLFVSHDVEPSITRYHCPMHPAYTSDRPGDCPICGMRLVPVPEAFSSPPSAAPPVGPQPDLASAALPPEGDVAGLASVHVTADQVALAGVRTEVAIVGEITSQIRAVGNVVADETRVRQVTTKVAGWIERLHVNNVGQAVRAGQPLLDLYSPELLASQAEYLRARQTAATFETSSLPEVRRGGRDLADAARRRLELFDVPADYLARLDESGAAQRTITLRAPFDGFVTEKLVLEGQRIDAGMPLVTLTDLSRVWVVAQLYESEAAVARPGRAATVSPQYDPATRLAGRVSLVYPTVDPQSRTIQVRFEFVNPRLVLKPGMYVDVELERDRSTGIIVPDSALMDTGTRQIVFVETSAGHFEPRAVQAGLRSEGRILIARGLVEGERVAISANFLLDSESRLRAAIGSAVPGHEQHR